MRRALSGDLDAGFVLVTQIAAGALLLVFTLVAVELVAESVTGEPGVEIGANAQNVILTLSGGVVSLLSTIVGRFFGGAVRRG